MLKPIDKVSFGLMSELPGCNVSERWASLVKIKVRWSSLSIIGEDSMDYFRLAKGIMHTGGVLAATRNRKTMETGEVLYAPGEIPGEGSAL
jgi:hypothetical protein